MRDKWCLSCEFTEWLSSFFFFWNSKFAFGCRKLGDGPAWSHFNRHTMYHYTRHPRAKAKLIDEKLVQSRQWCCIWTPKKSRTILNFYARHRNPIQHCSSSQSHAFVLRFFSFLKVLAHWQFHLPRYSNQINKEVGNPAY